jgi:hypothetical protein
MAWTNGPLTLYHGTIGPFAYDIQANGAMPGRSRRRIDFGQGFYTTTNWGQARLHANDLYKKLLFAGVPPIPQCAAIVEFSIDLEPLSKLETLSFVRPSNDWSDLVNNCRSGRPHRPSGIPYDVVFGPVWRLSGSAIPDYDQVSFHSQRAANLLLLVGVERGKPQL